MPNRRIHLKASKELLGTKNPIVHDILDYQSPTLEHRFRHTPKTVELIATMGKEAEREAWLHIFMDWGIIEYPLTKK